MGTPLLAAAATGSAGAFTEFALAAGNRPESIAPGPDGNLWFTQDGPNGNEIGRITPTGVITEFPIPTTTRGLGGIVAGPQGMWFTEGPANRIGRIRLNGAVREFPVPTNNALPAYITLGPDGNLWFTELFALQVGRITPEGVITEFPLPSPTGAPEGITAGPDGNLWVAAGSVIHRVTPDGVATGFATPTPFAGGTGIAPGADGNLWFTERDVDEIGRITPEGDITEFSWGNGDKDRQPYLITAGPDGNLWFTESGPNANKIGRIFPSSGELGGFSIPTPSSAPVGIAAGPDANLWFTESGVDNIGRVTDNPQPTLTLNPSSGPPGASVSVSGSGFGSFEHVRLTFADPAGNSLLANPLTDAAGRFAVTVAIPSSATPGNRSVKATGQISGLVIRQPFTVT